MDIPVLPFPAFGIDGLVTPAPALAVTNNALVDVTQPTVFDSDIPRSDSPPASADPQVLITRLIAERDQLKLRLTQAAKKETTTVTKVIKTTTTTVSRDCLCTGGPAIRTVRREPEIEVTYGVWAPGPATV